MQRAHFILSRMFWNAQCCQLESFAAAFLLNGSPWKRQNVSNAGAVHPGPISRIAFIPAPDTGRGKVIITAGKTCQGIALYP
jgi:hypothetical protein